MNPFVAVAKVTFSTIVAAFTTFMAICLIWYASLLLEFSQIMVFVFWRINEITTACIGLAAGWYVARYYARVIPFVNAAVSALLVELLHASISGGRTTFETPLKLAATLAISAGIAVVTAWVLMKVLPPRAGSADATTGTG